jgi:hypothetical protein
VNTNVAGTYVITYSAIDSSGNSADTKTRTVIVETVVELIFENSAQVEANKFQFLEQESIPYRFSANVNKPTNIQVSSNNAFSDNIYFPFHFDVTSSDLDRIYSLRILITSQNFIVTSICRTRRVSFKVELIFDGTILGSSNSFLGCNNVGQSFTVNRLDGSGYKSLLNEFTSPGRYYLLFTISNPGVSSYGENWSLFDFS